jgi:hypothetical protein
MDCCQLVHDLYVDSAGSEDGVAILRLEEPLEGLVSVALLEAEVPVSYAVFLGGSLVLQLAGPGAPSQPLRAAIPDGNHTLDALAELVAAALVEAAQGTGATFTVELDGARQCLTVTRTDGDGANTVAAAQYLSAYVTDVMPRLPGSLPARSVSFAPSVAGPPSLFVRSNLAELLHATHAVTAREQSCSSVLDRLQQASLPGETLFYVNRMPVQCRTTRDHRVAHVSVWLTFPDDLAPLDFRGHTWSVKIRATSRAPPRHGRGM